MSDPGDEDLDARPPMSTTSDKMCSRKRYDDDDTKRKTEEMKGSLLGGGPRSLRNNVNVNDQHTGSRAKFNVFFWQSNIDGILAASIHHLPWPPRFESRDGPEGRSRPRNRR